MTLKANNKCDLDLALNHCGPDLTWRCPDSGINGTAKCLSSNGMEIDFRGTFSVFLDHCLYIIFPRGLAIFITRTVYVVLFELVMRSIGNHHTRINRHTLKK